MRAARSVLAQSLGARSFKGFANPLAVVAVERMAIPIEASAARRAAAPRHVGAAMLVAVLAAGAFAPVHAQSDGLHFSSRSGAAQLTLSGRLDVEGYVPQDEPTWLIPTTNAFAAVRARVFADIFVGERVYGLVELRGDRGHAPADGDLEARVQQVFLRFRPLTNTAVTIQAGKFASPFGAYVARHHAAADPLIRPPLPYDQRTLIAPGVAPGGLDGFLAWKDSARARRAVGAPVVWDVPYPWGALATIGVGRLGARFAILGSAPSADPETWELAARRFRQPNVMAGFAYRIVPDLTVGIAWNRGPYLEPLASGALPEGSALADFAQETLAVDAAYARGRTSVHAELFLNRWEVPNLPEHPLDISFYVESATHLSAGLFVTARYGEIRYSRMGAGTPSARAGERWDLNQRRLQLGGGYRLFHDTEVRAEYLINHTSGPTDPRDNLLSAQISWAF